MKLIDQSETHEYYLDIFNGSEIRLVKDIETGTFSIFTEDLAKALGFENEEQMLSSDIMLDIGCINFAEKFRQFLGHFIFFQIFYFDFF